MGDHKPSAQDRAEARAYMEAEFRLFYEKMFTTLLTTYGCSIKSSLSLMHCSLTEELNKMLRKNLDIYGGIQ